jgi:hypothetical protein
MPTTSITSLTSVHMLMYLHCFVLEQKIKEVGFMLGTYLNTGPAQVVYDVVGCNQAYTLAMYIQ